MTGSIDSLLVATLTFVGSHILLSSQPMRVPLTGWFGEGGFRALYSTVALVTLVWMVLAYLAAPFVPVWSAGSGARLVSVLLMLPASLLFVAAASTPSPTAVGGERLAREPRPVAGILTVTRHPMLWSFVLWAVAHIIATGHLAALILFGGTGALALLGMAHIDWRRARSLGSGWGPMAMATSLVPFAAALGGRAAVDWAGIGLVRLAGGLALYVALLVAHPWVFGGDPLAGL